MAAPIRHLSLPVLTRSVLPKSPGETEPPFAGLNPAHRPSLRYDGQDALACRV
ncbi:MAG: hypothetical protein JWR00_2023, partial [Rubritepida sp.]|nr:hypothetical protein [Rubritepida sp.]